MNVKKKRGPTPLVSDDEIIKAIIKLNIDVFEKKASKKMGYCIKDRNEKFWKDILIELNGKIRLLNLLTRLRNSTDFFYKSIHSANDDSSFEIDEDICSKKTNECTVTIVRKYFLNDQDLKPLIRVIGRVPFYVIYHWPEQELFWKQHSQKLKFLTVLNTVNVDIILRKNEKVLDSRIILYQLLGELEQQIVPLFQLIINTRDTSYSEKIFAKRIFGEWLRNKVSKSRISIIDLTSAACVEATSISCNNASLNQHVNSCFKYLNGDVNSKPACILKINSIPLIRFLKNSNYFNDEDEEKNEAGINKFFINCIILLSNVTDFNLFSQIVENIFILLKSEVINEHVKSANKYFIEHFKTAFFKNFQIFEKEFQENYENTDQPFFHQNIENFPKETNNYFKKIEQKILKNCSSESNIYELPNPYFSEILFKKMVSLLVYFPV